MNTRNVTAFVAPLLMNQIAFADASYQTTTQITGGSFVDSVKQVSFLSKAMKDMLAPTSTLIGRDREQANVARQGSRLDGTVQVEVERPFNRHQSEGEDGKSNLKPFRAYCLCGHGTHPPLGRTAGA